MTTCVLTGGVDAGGRPVALRLDDATGTIVTVGPHVDPATDEAVVDCRDLVVLPAAAEPHVHLDKVATVREAPNPSGELLGAVQAWLVHAPTIGFDDVHRRATATIDDYVGNGVTAVRTNVNLHPTIDPGVLDAILQVRGDVADRCTVQVVGMFMAPLTGSGELADANRALVEQACELGIDVIGGAPFTDRDPTGAVAHLGEAAARRGLPIDLHIDETLDVGARTLRAFADVVEEHGLGGRATAGHCVSLGMQAADEQRETAARLAAVGIAAVTLPTTNLWLQGRSHPTATPRGLTAVRALLDAGVVVATGADNIEDPFCPLGRADPFDAARLLALAAHLDPAEAWHAAGRAARASMGLPDNDLVTGARADLVAVEGRDLGEALARGSARRVVVRGGTVVAATAVTRTTGPAFGPARVTGWRTGP